MQSKRWQIVVLASMAALCFLAVANSQEPKLDRSNMPAELNGKEGTVTGYVRDLACPYRNQSKEAAKPPSDICVKSCVKAGAPLGIITEDGTIYNIISHNMPDFDERAKLVPYAAKTVRASGRVFERNGSHAIAIDKIEEVK